MYLYIAVFPNNKKYIGISNNFEKRKVVHKSRAKNKWKSIFCNAIRKYGFENISWIVADGYQSWNILCDLEKELIKNYNTCCLDSDNNGYNATRGGDGYTGFKHTSEWKNMMSKRMSGKNSPSYGRKLTNKQKEHLSKLNSGENHPRYGKPRTLKQKKKMEEGLAKYYEINGHPWCGRNHSDDSKLKISKRNSGENNGMYGVRGENHHSSKLTFNKAENIRKKYKTGKYSYKSLAEIFNISLSQVGNIINNKVWKETNNG